MENAEILERLNAYVDTISFSMIDYDDRLELRLLDFDPIYFCRKSPLLKYNSANWVQRKHSTGKVHEPSMLAALLFILDHFPHKIKTSFDIGVLFGYFSLIIKNLFSSSKVICLEMNPDYCHVILQNISINSQLAAPPIECVNVGVSNVTKIDQKVNIDGFILREVAKSNEAINLVTLDDYCEKINTYPDLIKIDVEGYQAKIIPGGLKCIEKSKPIILLEFDNSIRLKPFNTTNKEIIRPLFAMGYSCLWCNEQRLEDGQFINLTTEIFNQSHEKNSLAVLIHEDDLKTI